MKTTKFSTRLFTILLISTLLNSVAHAKQVLDKIVAIVNKQVISQYELDNYTKFVMADLKSKSDAALPPKSVLQEQILQRMILDRIQVQMAEQTGIEVDSITISQAIQHIAKQQGLSVEEFKRKLESRGMPFDDYREVVRTDLLVQQVQAKEVAQNVVVAKSDVESFLTSPAGQDNSGTEYRLSHILLTTPEAPTPTALKQIQTKAEDLVASLKAGADFGKTAMVKSAGRQALNGGDLGWRMVGEVPTMFVNYVPSMKVGDIVGPIRTSGGFHIIKLQDKRIANADSHTETRVRHILIVPDNRTSSEEALALLTDLRQQIAGGSDFATIAQKKSHDLRTASKGGDMGWITENEVLPKFYQVMAQLRNNELSEPFQTDEGWNLIQVLDRRSQHTSSAAAWNRATEILITRKTNEALEAWTKQIRDEANVTIL